MEQQKHQDLEPRIIFSTQDTDALVKKHTHHNRHDKRPNYKQFLGYSNDLRLSFVLRHASFPIENSDTSHLSTSSVAAPRA